MQKKYHFLMLKYEELEFGLNHLIEKFAWPHSFPWRMILSEPSSRGQNVMYKESSFLQPQNDGCRTPG